VDHPAGYPYRLAPLVPAWSSGKSQALAALACAAVVVALWTRAPLSLADVDTIALEVVLPGALAFVLAFAPTPLVLGNRIVKDLVTVWTTLAVFAGDRMVLMLVALPAVLALSIALGHTRLGRSWWGGEP
jgi:hypothetical protein